MLARLSIAFVGASVVTIVLILGMNEIAEYFERPDSQVYMRVRDFIPGAGGRRLPDRRMPEAQPDRTRVGPGEIATQPTSGTAATVELDERLDDIDVRLELEAPPAE